MKNIQSNSSRRGCAGFIQITSASKERNARTHIPGWNSLRNPIYEKQLSVDTGLLLAIAGRGKSAPTLTARPSFEFVRIMEPLRFLAVRVAKSRQKGYRYKHSKAPRKAVIQFFAYRLGPVRHFRLFMTIAKYVCLTGLATTRYM